MHGGGFRAILSGHSFLLVATPLARCDVNRELLLFFAGARCEEQDDCASEPCENGGECTSLAGGGFSCQCLEGFEGLTCETDVDECEIRSDVCLNGGTCVNTEGSYRFESASESCPLSHTSAAICPPKF